MLAVFSELWTPLYALAVAGATAVVIAYLMLSGRAQDPHAKTIKLSPGNCIMFLVFQVVLHMAFCDSVSKGWNSWYMEHPVVTAVTLTIGALTFTCIICGWIDARWFRIKRK